MTASRCLRQDSRVSFTGPSGWLALSSHPPARPPPFLSAGGDPFPARPYGSPEACCARRWSGVAPQWGPTDHGRQRADGDVSTVLTGVSLPPLRHLAVNDGQSNSSHIMETPGKPGYVTGAITPATQGQRQPTGCWSSCPDVPLSKKCSRSSSRSRRARRSRPTHREGRRARGGSPGSAASGASEQPGTWCRRPRRRAPPRAAVRGACPSQRKPARSPDHREGHRVAVRRRSR